MIVSRRHTSTYEELVLSALQRILSLEESETDEKTSEDVECHLSHDEAWVSPVIRGITFDQDTELVEPGSSEFTVVGSRGRRLATAFGMNTVDLLLKFLGFARLDPDVMPVSLRVSGRASTSDSQNVFRTRL